MKNRVIALLMSVFCTSMMWVKADSISMGYVDLERVFSSQVIADEVDGLKDQFEKIHHEFEKEQKALESLVAQHEKESSMMSKSIRDSKEAELRDKANKLSQKGASLTQEYYGQQQQIKAKYMQKIEGIAVKLANKYKLQVIHVKHSLLYVDSMFDLTDEMLNDLR